MELLYRESINEIRQRVSKVVGQFILPVAVIKRSPCSMSLSALLVSCPYFCHFGGRVVVWHSDLVCISLVTENTEHLFTFCIFGHLYSFSWEVPKPLSIGLLSFLWFVHILHMIWFLCWIYVLCMSSPKLWLCFLLS